MLFVRILWIISGRLARRCCLAGLAVLLLGPGSSLGQIPVPFSRIAPPGFGDPENSYSWSMAWFNGNLYVGTARAFPCVEQATLAYYFPNLAPYVGLLNPPGVECPGNVYENDLRAEIWRYSPMTGNWTMVFRSELIANPIVPGGQVARDIGYRDMQVFTEPSGGQALYIVGCTAREFNPGLPPPRILRMTIGPDPTTGLISEVFQPIPQDPGTFLAGLNAVTYRATAVYNGRFYVTASPSLIGDGYLLVSETPWLGNNAFRQVTPSNLSVYELSVFNNQLYIGAGDTHDGYSVWRTDASGDPFYNLTPVVVGGAGRGAAMTSVVSMYPFQDQLYVGSAGWFNSLLPSSELIRINPDDSWQVVAGNPRLTSQGLLFPISGLPDGFGNPFNAHIWRMSSAGHTLFAGTNDDSWSLIGSPLAPFFSTEFGFDLFTSRDGASWSQATRNGYGNPYTFGIRCLVPSPSGMFLGSVNYAEGTEVMLDPSNRTIEIRSSIIHQAASPSVGPAGPSGGHSIPVHPSLVTPFSVHPLHAPPLRSVAAVGEEPPLADQPAAPSLLDVDDVGGSVVLSWEPSPGAVRYRIFRSDFRRTDIGFLLGLGRPPGKDEPIPRDARPGPGVFELPGPFRPIATTSVPSFQDRTIRPGKTYAYQVQAEDGRGRASDPSNRATFPTFDLPATFVQARNVLAGRRDPRRAPAEAPRELVDLLDEARKATASGDLDVARDRLVTLLARVRRNEGRRLDAAALDEAGRLLERLGRRIELVRARVLTRENLERRETPPIVAPPPAPARRSPAQRAPARRRRTIVSTPIGR